MFGTDTERAINFQAGRRHEEEEEDLTRRQKKERKRAKQKSVAFEKSLRGEKTDERKKEVVD